MVCSGTRRKSSKQFLQISCQSSTTFDKGKPPNVGEIDILVSFNYGKYSPFKSETCKVPVRGFKDITSVENADFSQ